MLMLQLFQYLQTYWKIISRDKRSVTKSDKLLRKLFEVIYLHDIPHRSRKRDFDGIQVTVPCGTNLILLFWYQGPVAFGSTY